MFDCRCPRNESDAGHGQLLADIATLARSTRRVSIISAIIFQIVQWYNHLKGK